MYRIKYLLDYFKDQIDLDQISFILLNDQKSFDQDIYIVTKQNVSFFKLWKHDGTWYEVFVDSEKVLHNKIENYDEIILNFMSQFLFYYGDHERYQRIYEMAIKAKKNYVMSLIKRRKIQYRVKVLSSKMTGDALNDTFIISSMAYPIAQLLLEKAGIMQCSPKFWTEKIRENCDGEHYSLFEKLLLRQITGKELQTLIDYVCDDFEGIDLNYGEDNNSTFVC